jgi:thymidylate kinase
VTLPGGRASPPPPAPEERIKDYGRRGRQYRPVAAHEAPAACRSDLGCVLRGLFVAVEGIDGAGKTTAAWAAADALRSRGRHAVAVVRGDGAWSSAYLAGHMAALRELIWGEPPDAPYLDLGDEHWVHLQAAWYAAFARCVVMPAVAEGAIVLADTWGYKFLAKLALRPPARVSFEAAWNMFQGILRPDVVVHLHADAAVAAARKPSFSGATRTPSRSGWRPADSMKRVSLRTSPT